MLKFDEATYLSLLFKFILSQILSNSLWGLDVLLFAEFIVHFDCHHINLLLKLMETDN